MIVGIGVDIIEIGRIKETIQRQGDGFVKKVFTEGEILYCTSKPSPAQHYAARFAAKEALSKALGTGIRDTVRLRDIEVVNAESGAPSFIFYNDLAEKMKALTVHLSLSHSDTSVVAFAVVEERIP